MNRFSIYASAVWLSTCLFASQRASADALVVTTAMRASTIAEVYVEPEEVRVEIEVGAADLAAFRNVLPDELYEKITGEKQALAGRLSSFLEDDWLIVADGLPLAGTVQQVLPGKRIVRDEVTGDPLPDQPEDAENVIQIRIAYALENPPSSITFQPPTSSDTRLASANIGFVVYHRGVAVNDFRYLSQDEKLDLDWEDPWYSRFHNTNLRRQFDAPLSTYLYVEPYEVRKEIVVRPKDLQAWHDLGLPADGVIRVDQQEELKKRVAEFLTEKNPVEIDGRPAVGRLDRIHFIHRTLRTSGIIEPAVDLDVNSATLGVIFVYPVDSLPEHVSMNWELFSPRIQVIPAVASDEAGGLPSQITPDEPFLVWNNYLTNPSSPQLIAIPRPHAQRRLVVPVVSVVCGVVLVVMATAMRRHWSKVRRFSRPALAAAIALLCVAVVSLPFARITIADPFDVVPAPSQQRTQEILSGLLHNVYRSFDHHDDRLVYDRLAKSISGELLSHVYLTTRKSMEVRNQGGLRISVKEVLVTELESVTEKDMELTCTCRWRVSGWIGHWGHIHQRANEHVAILSIGPRDGMWKITALEMLDEQRLDSGNVGI